VLGADAVEMKWCTIGEGCHGCDKKLDLIS